jgi:signal transduction histidine kinase
MRLRLTLRLRLTALYATLFLLGAGLLLGASYLLVSRSLTSAPERLESRAIDRIDSRFGSDPEQAAERRLAQEVRAQVTGESLSELRLWYGSALVGLAGLCIGSGWLLSGRSLRRVGEIEEAARRVSSEQLGARIGLRGPEDELKGLADTIDSMLARLDQAFDRQRRFIANASHELRTPLAVMRTEIDVTLANSQADRDELRAMAETVRRALDTSERLMSSLLVLARSDALAERRAVDLSTAARNAIGHLGDEIRTARLDLSVKLAPAVVYGDRRLLERLAANLVENGVRHNRRHGFVSVETRSSVLGATVVVENSGPSVPPEAVATLTEPFSRLGPRRGRPRGSGLGLSIANAVVKAHGGRLLLTPRPGGGLSATVELPRVMDGDRVDGGLRVVDAHRARVDREPSRA